MQNYRLVLCVIEWLHILNVEPHLEELTMWTLNQIMEAGAMGVQITVSGKLRGDRSAFEKHTQGILPRAGNYAKELVSEDITPQQKHLWD